MRRICSSLTENVSILYLGTCTFFHHKREGIIKAEHGQDISVLAKHGLLVVFKVCFTLCPKPAVHCLLCSLGCLPLHSVNALSSLAPSLLGFVWPRRLLGAFSVVLSLTSGQWFSSPIPNRCPLAL